MVSIIKIIGSNIYEYVGLSIDTKPTDCGENSSFFEYDTGDIYYFHNDTWAKVGG